MSRDLARQTKKGSDVRCKSCKNGKHYPDCEERACACWCLSPSVPATTIGKPKLTWPEDYKDPTYLLQRMADHGIVVRFGLDGTVYYKPSPKTLPDHMRALLSEYRREIYRLFLPLPEHWSYGRPYWKVGSVGPCCVCGQGSAQWNPSGVCQHPTCGWFTQRQWSPSKGASRAEQVA